MSAQSERDQVNIVRLVGRIEAAPVETDLPSGDAIASLCHRRPSRGTRLDAARRHSRLHDMDAASAPLGEDVAQGRRRRGRGRHPTQVLRDGGGALVSSGHRGQCGADDSSCTERMSTPRVGLGWKDVAFSGRRPPRLTTFRTARKSGAGNRTATVCGPARVSASSAV